MGDAVTVHGDVRAGFEPVRDAFVANFEHHEERGAACTVLVDGEAVVDIWAGVANERTGAPWAEDTLSLVFSTTKAATALCALLLAQRGQLDLSAPVARYWPEFAAAGKVDVPVEWLLTHRAGLSSVDADLTPEQVYAWDPVVDALAAQAPYWEPGTAHGYHAVTFGNLVGEVIRRVDGRSPGRFFAEEVAGPLGIDFHIGLPEEHWPRMSRLGGVPLPTSLESGTDDLPPGGRELVAAFGDKRSLARRAFFFVRPAWRYNSPETWAAEMPAANGACTARALATMYASLVGEVDGVRLLTQETVDQARTERSGGPDRVMFRETRFGLGFALPTAISPMLGPGSFKHHGAGGSLGCADPTRRVAFGYVMNRLQSDLRGDPRTLGLLAGLERCL